jgi:hypothetical protein
VHREVALEIVRSELSTDPEQLVRLQREACLAGRRWRAFTMEFSTS